MIDFDDLAPHEEQVRYGGKEYTLREATAGAAATWRNALLKASKVQDGKLSGIGDGMAECDMVLVSLCLTLDGKPVPVPTLRSWPQRVVDRLADRAKEVSGLNPKGEVEAPTPTTSSSAPSPDGSSTS